ncbi:hypothetical protein [Streptomyces mirabilis]
MPFEWAVSVLLSVVAALALTSLPDFLALADACSAVSPDETALPA